MVRPFFSIIIPLTEKISYLFPFTLDSLALQQKEESFEVILIHKMGKKATLAHLPINCAVVLQTTHVEMAPMLNQAIAQASGEYIHILFPGEFTLRKKLLLSWQK